MLINTPALYYDAKAYIQEQTAPLTVDRETNGLDWRVHKTCGACLLAGDHSYYFAFRHAEGLNLPLDLLADFHATILRPDRPQTYHHSSYDLKIGAFQDGQQLPADGCNFDTIIAAMLLNENDESMGLKELCAKYIDGSAADASHQLDDYLHTRFGGSKYKTKQHLWKVPADIVAPYGEQDVILTRRLREFQEKHLTNWRLADLHRSVCDFQTDLCRIEMRGIQLDAKSLPALEAHAIERERECLARMKELAGWRVNPNSSAQVKLWLDLDGSADKKALKAMGTDERAQLILDARSWGKVTSTYYKPYAALADRHGVLRGNLHLTTPGRLSARYGEAKRNGTIAGRLSASDPNLHQVPRESDTYRVKELFIARPGKLLAELDYSQAELRVAAHYSRDEWLTARILEGVDLHTAVSTQFNIPRPIAKNINFSVWYLIGAATFSKQYNVPLDESKVYLARYHKQCPGVRRLGGACEALAKGRGYIELFTGRLRHFNCPEAEPYTASNNLIQGTVAEIMRRAMMRIEREEPSVAILMQVHDSIWIEVADTPAGLATLARCRAIMQDVPEISLPMIVDAKIGRSLGTAKALPRSSEGCPVAALEHAHPRCFGVGA